MNIGVSAPVLVGEFQEFLRDADYQKGQHLGLGGSQVNQICALLLERGYELTIFTLDKKVGEEIILEGPHLRICVGPYRKFQRQRASDFFRTERNYLERAVQRESPDFVHAHWTYEFALGPLSTSVPVLTTIRDWAPRILWEMRTPYRLLRLLMAIWVFVKGRHFTSNSEYIRQCVEQWTPHRAPVIPNGLRERYFFEGERTPNLDSPRLLSINSGFGKLKNVQTLLRALQELRREHPQVTLRLLGEKYGEGEEAHQWSRERGLSDGVNFVGQVDHDQVIMELREADVLVHPSREESFGNTLVEAMAQKTPVVAGKESGAVPWVLDRGKAGALTDVTDPTALASSIRSILNSEDLWYSYSESGYQRANTAFRLSKIIDKYVKIYKEKII